MKLKLLNSKPVLRLGLITAFLMVTARPVVSQRPVVTTNHDVVEQLPAGGVTAGVKGSSEPGLTGFVPRTVSVGKSSVYAVTADVNLDGHPDLISVDFGAATLTVLTNNGRGDFGSNATYNVDIGPFSVVAADINSDGRPDLVSANYNYLGDGSGTLTVLTNNGTGGFVATATLAVDHGTRSVAAVDLNGDGRVDLISANYSDGTLTVLTNDGRGGFALKATLNPGSHPSCVVAADANGDGQADLITGGFAPNSVTVFTNDGKGDFGLNAVRVLSGTPDSVALADINGDGRMDLIIASYYANALTILTNDGYGNFGFNTTLDVGIMPRSVTAADIDGDGTVDLICPNDGLNLLLVLTNNGSGIFGYKASPLVDKSPVYVTAADINGDGRMDLISANGLAARGSAGTLTVLTQTTVGLPQLAITPAGTNAFVLAWSSYSSGFVLETNADLTSPNWKSAGYFISITNLTNESITLKPPAGNLFFRLKQ